MRRKQVTLYITLARIMETYRSKSSLDDYCSGERVFVREIPSTVTPSREPVPSQKTSALETDRKSQQ